MKRFLLPLALALSACTTIPAIPPSPASVANQTKLDEQTGLAITSGYRAAVAAARLANQIRPFSPGTKTRAAELDAKAFAAVAAVRSAYEAGNAESYAAAATKARLLIDQIIALAGDVT